MLGVSAHKQSEQYVFWTASAGIANNRQLLSFFTELPFAVPSAAPTADTPITPCDDADSNSIEPTMSIKHLSKFHFLNRLAVKNSASSDNFDKCHNIVVGWGNKPNTRRAQQFAEKNHLPYWRLEDGFIAFLNHPSTDTRRLSLICDQQGIYYDASKPCDLEDLLNTAEAWCDTSLESRAERVRSSLLAADISKYNLLRNELPSWLSDLAEQQSIVLLVDQTVGDASIRGALASPDSFDRMLADALQQNPDAHIVIKTHTDVVLGKKQGYFSDLAAQPERVHLLTEDVSLNALFTVVQSVYTVSSQLGFEALLREKPVHCYGMPFYAGWGLTLDQLSVERRQNTLSLNQLVAAALIRYPKYCQPDTQTLCEVEQVIDWLLLQMQDSHNTDQAARSEVCYAVNFSLWKRSFIPEFIGRRSKKIVFVPSLTEARERANKHDVILLWGRSLAQELSEKPICCAVNFIEDGFIRSVGLGADLRRPDSLVIDNKGMYYDPSVSSQLIDMLNQQSLSDAEITRAKALADKLLALKISKYNVGSTSLSLVSDLKRKINKTLSQGQHIILVPGQFEADLSVRCSLGEVKTNAQLLAAVRADFPQAFIIFKEHPDLYSGVRPGALGKEKAEQLADVYVSDIDITELIEMVDRVCTLTSLTGFEALLRNKKVSVYGSPFYAGWGLTDDKCTFSDRQKSLELAELVDGVLIKYARYINWQTRLLTTPEFVIDQLAEQKTQQRLGQTKLKSSWLARQLRKLEYFWHAYRKVN